MEYFDLNPCAGDINSSSNEGSKLHLNATDELLDKDKVLISISNGLKVRKILKKCRSNFS